MAEKYILLVIMIPVGAVIQFGYITFRLNGEWQQMSSSKKFGSIFMGSIAATLVVLFLSDNEALSIRRIAFFAVIAALLGGELVQLLMSFFKRQIKKKLGGNGV